MTTSALDRLRKAVELGVVMLDVKQSIVRTADLALLLRVYDAGKAVCDGDQDLENYSEVGELCKAISDLEGGNG